MSLANLTFVNTRPTHQAEALNHLLQAFGANTLHFPTLEIEAINAPQTKTICQQLKNQDAAIFVSANAVYCSQEYWPSTFPISTVIAVGPGTEKTLRQYGITRIVLPEKFNSEGILALPSLASVQDKKIIIFCGEDPKPLLQETLTQQGAIVTLCPCYRRLCPTPDKDALRSLNEEKLSGIISTSRESLKNLDTLLRDNANLKETPLVVISPNMENLAKIQGWEKVLVAPDASNNAIIKTLIKLKLD